MTRRLSRAMDRVLDALFGPRVDLDPWAGWLVGLERGHTQGRL